MSESLGSSERELLLKSGMRPGDTATIWRDISHISTDYPRPHTDAILVRYDGDGQFTILSKTHLEEE
jgi:hypothetical protein